MSDKPIEVGRVTVRMVSVPGDLLVHIERSDGMSVLEAVGMLAMAQNTILDGKAEGDD